MNIPQSTTVIHGYPQLAIDAKNTSPHHTTTVFLWGVGSVCGGVVGRPEAFIGFHTVPQSTV